MNKEYVNAFDSDQYNADGTQQILNQVHHRSDVPTAPDVDSCAISFFTQQQLRRPVPEGDDSISVWSVFVVDKVESRQTEVSKFDLATE